MCKAVVATLHCVFLLCLGVKSYAQKVRTITASAQIRVEDNMSLDQANQKAIEKARINAIKESFGEVVVQGNSMYIRNIETGQEVQTQNVFNQMADTYANGEWLEDVKPPDKRIFQHNGETWIEVTLTCKVRELAASKVTFTAQALSCPELKCKTEVFNEGQDLFLSFIAPVDGFLTVYLEVPAEKLTYRLLTYQSENTLTCYPVKGDQPYILFSEKHNTLANVKSVDGFTCSLSAQKYAEQNALVVIFSPDFIFDKPVLKGNGEVQKTGTPLHLPIDEFQNWVLRIQKKSPEIKVNKSIFTIQP